MKFHALDKERVVEPPDEVRISESKEVKVLKIYSS